jgi:acyl-CoA synthetase (NDP forming)
VAAAGSGLVALLAAPRSIAVVGASPDVRRPAGRPLDYLRRYGFPGRIVPVTSRHTEINGHTAVARLSELPAGSVDVAVVTLPAPLVLDALRDAEKIGVSAAVVVGSGFEDRDSVLRQDLDEFVANSELRVIGPNCLGSVAVPGMAYLTFSSVLRAQAPRPGRIGLVTQSGALGNSLLQTLIRRNVGLGHWVSSGNEVDVGALELATGMLYNDDIDAVGLFLEGITDPDWLPALDAVIHDTGKHLYVLKAARSPAGGRAAIGHTGRIVGSSDASQAILADIGAREVATVGALADALAVASICPRVRRTRLPRVGIVSVSGAAGVIAADRVAQAPRLRMAAVDSAVTLDRRLRLANPLDVPFLDETPVFADAIEAFAVPEVCDVVVAVESGLAHDRPTLVARLTAHRTPVPVVLTSLSEDDPVPPAHIGVLADAGVAFVPSVDRAVDAVGATAPDVTECTSELAAEPVGPAAYLGLEAVAALLPPDFPWAPWRLVDSDRSLADAVAQLGFPLVLKAAGRTIQHRTELGAVRLVRTPDDLNAALAAVEPVCTAHGDAVLAQQLVPDGFEILLSAVHDPEFGPVAFVRVGGVLAERMALQVVLWSGWDANRRLAILRRSALGELLDGYRGGVRYDVRALADLVSAALDTTANRLGQLELNPVIVGERGARVADALARPQSDNGGTPWPPLTSPPT